MTGVVRGIMKDRVIKDQYGSGSRSGWIVPRRGCVPPMGATCQTT